MSCTLGHRPVHADLPNSQKARQGPFQAVPEPDGRIAAVVAVFICLDGPPGIPHPGLTQQERCQFWRPGERGALWAGPRDISPRPADDTWGSYPISQLSN